MAFWSRPSTKPTQAGPQTATELSAEQRINVEEMLSDGYTSAEIAQELDIPVVAVYAVKRAVGKREERIAAKGGRVSPAAPTLDNETEAIQAEIKRARLLSELESAKQDAAYERERRSLELDIKRNELAMQRMELHEMMYPPEPEHGDIQDYMLPNGEPNLLAFLMDLKRQNDSGKRSQAAPQTQTQPITGEISLDVTKPLTREQILAEMGRATPQEVAQLRRLPDFMLNQGIAQRYPGITEQNIKAVIQEIRHYGEQRLASSTRVPTEQLSPAIERTSVEPVHTTPHSVKPKPRRGRHPVGKPRSDEGAKD